MKHYLLTLIILFFSVYKLTAQIEKEQDWTSYVQSINITNYIGFEFRVSAAIRKENSLTQNGFAALWVRIDINNNEVGFFENEAGGNNLTDKWERYQIEGIVDENAKLLNFGALCQGNVKVYYDDFKVEIKNKNGEWKSLKINNSGFEEDVIANRIDRWSEGIDSFVVTIIKDFSISYSTEKPYKGEKSLRIFSENIK